MAVVDNTGEPGLVGLLLGEARQLRMDMGDMRRELNEKVDRVESQTRETNGRVRQLELWRAKVEGVKVAVSWVPTLLTAVAGSGVGGIIVLLVR